MDPELDSQVAERPPSRNNVPLIRHINMDALVASLHEDCPQYLERFTFVPVVPSTPAPSIPPLLSPCKSSIEHLDDLSSEMAAGVAGRAARNSRRDPVVGNKTEAAARSRSRSPNGPSAQTERSAEVRSPVFPWPSAQQLFSAKNHQDFSEDTEMPQSEDFVTVTSRSQKRKLKTTKSQADPPKKVPAKAKNFAKSDRAQARPTEGSGDSNMEEPRGERVPPLYIREKAQWQKILPLLDKLDIVFNYARSTAIGIRVQCPDSANHRRLSATLRSEKIGYHTYALQDERVLRTVIKGLPQEIKTDLIKEDLVSQGIPVIEVHRMYQRRSKKPYDMVLVIAELTPAGHRIRDLTSVCRLSGLKFEDPEGKGRAMQCHNCQLYGHGARYCFAQPRCVKCLESHNTSECPRKQPTEEPPSCVLCGDKGHPANYRGCPKAPKAHCRRAKPSGSRSARPPPEKFVPAPPPATNAWSRPLNQPKPAQVPSTKATANNDRVPPPCPPAAAPVSVPKPARFPAPSSTDNKDDTFADNWQYVNLVLDLIDLDELDEYVRESKIDSTRALFKYSKLLRAIRSLRNNVNG